MKHLRKTGLRLPAMMLAILLLLGGCGSAEQNETTQTTTAANTTAAETTAATTAPESRFVWETDTPENQGFDSSVLPELYDTFGGFDLLSCAIVRNEKIIDEFYKDGYDAESRFVLHSASKSVTSALVGIAIDKGYIESVDVPVYTYFPEAELFQSEWGRQITLRHLLNHTSGIAGTDSDLWYDWRASDNWLDYVLALPLEAEPGTQFTYSTGNTHLLSAIVQQATGRTLLEFGNTYLFAPLGMDSVECPTDAQGICDGGNGFAMTVRDMLKFGQLFANGGVWEGEQIVSADWVAASTSVQYDRSTGSADYGYQWWVRTFGTAGYDAFFAQGHGGQYIFVVPALDLVIAITSDYTGSTGIYWEIAETIVNACG